MNKIILSFALMLFTLSGFAAEVKFGKAPWGEPTIDVKGEIFEGDLE